MSKVHIHEDDKGMRNVYPADAINEAMDDMEVVKPIRQKISDRMALAGQT